MVHMTLFKTIFWNSRHGFKNEVAITCIQTLFETSWNCKDKFENDDTKACILKLFEIVVETAIIQIFYVLTRSRLTF